MIIPILQTARLTLRPFEPGDAPAVEHLAGHPEVARFTFVPHPYPPGAAGGWIEGQAREAREDRQLAWAITAGPELLGCAELALLDGGAAELGYWLGVEHWHRGYAAEAAGAVVEYAVRVLARPRIQASVFTANPASARVLERLGFSRESTVASPPGAPPERAASWVYALTTRTPTASGHRSSPRRG